MKIGILADSHHGARNDSVPMQNMMAKFYGEVVFPTFDACGVSHVIHLGDVVDRRKYLNIATARFMHEHYNQPMAERGITQHITLGNHDIYWKSSTDVSAVEELYRHVPERVTIHSQPAEIEIDGCRILLLPWITDNNRDASMSLIQNSTCPIAMGHLELSGFQMFRGITNNEGLNPQLFDRFEMVLTGHYHHKSTVEPIHYVGAMWPMTWNDYNDPRGFHLFDTQTHELTYIPNPYSLFVKVVYDDKGKDYSYIQGLVRDVLAADSPHHDAYVKVIVKSREYPYWYDLLMDALYKVNAQDVLVVDDIVINDEDETDETSESPDVDTLTLMKGFVESLSISCDKDELFDYLQTKYHDAIAASQSARVL
jgi:predicted phosphodiesterase